MGILRRRTRGSRNILPKGHSLVAPAMSQPRIIIITYKASMVTSGVYKGYVRLIWGKPYGDIKSIRVM